MSSYPVESLWKWSSINLTASRSEAPQWSLISGPTKHNTSPRLKRVPLVVPPIPPLSLPPQFSAAMGDAAGAEAIFLVKPGPCLALQSQNTLHCMPCVHASIWTVCYCLFCEIVCNAYFFPASCYLCPYIHYILVIVCFGKCCLHLLSACLWTWFSSSKC